MISYKNDKTLNKEDILSIIEINTGTGWGRKEVIAKFKEKVDWLRNSGISQNKIYLIFFDLPVHILKKRYGNITEEKIIDSFKKDIGLESKNVLILSKCRWFDGEKDLYEPIEPFLDNLLPRLIKLNAEIQ